MCIYTVVNKKRATFIFWIASRTLANFNNFSQTSRKNLTQMNAVLTISLLYCCYTTLWNVEIVVWPFTTMSDVLDSTHVDSKMINWKVTNMIGNYCIAKSHTCHITSSLLQHVLKMPSSSANACGKRWHHLQTAGPTTCISQGSVATALKWDGQK